MERLKNKDLKEIKGGLLKIATSKLLIGLGAGVSFLIGLINGYQRPLPCNTK